MTNTRFTSSLVFAPLLCLALAGCGSSTPAPATAAEETSSDVVAATEVTGDEVEPVLTGGDREPNLPACPWTNQDDNSIRSPEGETFDSDNQEIVDFDGDGIDDVVLSVGGCDDNNDCMLVLLRGCVAPGYDLVFGPERGSNLIVGERGEDEVTAPLHLMGRAGTDGCDVPTRTDIRMTNSGWDRTVPCQTGGGIWDDTCEGEEPPRCEE